VCGPPAAPPLGQPADGKRPVRLTSPCVTDYQQDYEIAGGD